MNKNWNVQTAPNISNERLSLNRLREKQMRIWFLTNLEIIVWMKRDRDAAGRRFWVRMYDQICRRIVECRHATATSAALTFSTYANKTRVNQIRKNGKKFHSRQNTKFHRSGGSRASRGLRGQQRPAVKSSSRLTRPPRTYLFDECTRM